MRIQSERNSRAEARAALRRAAWVCALAACGASYAVWIRGAAPIRASVSGATVALVGDPAPARDDRPNSDALRIRISDILRRAAHDRGLDPRSAGRALAELGDDAIPVLLERFEAAAGAADSASPRGSLRCVLHALDAFDAQRVEESVRERVAVRTTERQVALLQAFGRAESSAALRWIGVVACASSAGLDDATRPVLAAALTSTLEVEPSMLARLGVAARRMPDDVAWTYVAVIGEASCPAALPVLAEVLDDRPELAVSVLPHLVALAERYPHLVSADIKESVRWRLLDGGSASELRELARAVGAVRDPESLVTLIDLLEHDEPAVSRSARQALERISGRTFGSRPGPWRDWLAREEDWFDQRLGPLVSVLDRGSLGDLTAALAELGQHRYRGDDIALSVVDLLRRDAPLVRVRTCQSLQALRSERAIPALVYALEDEEEQVRAAAHGALRAIAGADLGAEASRWREHFCIGD